MKFTNKETYLTYRADWKAEYKQLSINQRNLKFKVWFESLRNETRKTAELVQKYQEICQVCKQNWYDTSRNRDRATAMLKELKEAKNEAQRQYLAAKVEQLEIV